MIVRKNPSTGKWDAQYSYTDWQGKRKKTTKRGFRTKREAVEWYDHFRATQDADFNMVFKDFIDDSEKALTLDDDRLEQAIEQTGARLVVLDPIQGYIGSGVDMHRANEIRPLMHRLAKLAEKYSCAVILIGHMNKNSGDKSSYRGLGSIDFQAAARSVLVVGRIKDDPALRIVCPTKSSLAPEGKAVAFRLDPERGFQWVGQYDISADELLSGSSRGHKMRAAQDFLKEILADGAVPQTEIETAAEQAGIRPKTLRNARYELGVVSSKGGRQWVWALPEE